MAVIWCCDHLMAFMDFLVAVLGFVLVGFRV